MEHPCDLAERIGDLLLDEKTSDMTFIVEGEYLPAHRAILITSCEYFRALLQGKMKESLQSDVALEDVPLRGFKLLLSYVYTGQMKLKELDVSTILELLGIAHLYGVRKLEDTLCWTLMENLSIENVCVVYDKAYFLNLKELSAECSRLMIEDPNAILGSGGFDDLSEAALRHTLSQDTFCAKEIEIFKTVARWCAKHRSHADVSNVLKVVRFPLIDTQDLVTTVKDSGLISSDLLVDAIREKKCNTAGLPYRGSLKSGVNLAAKEFGAFTLSEKECGDYVTAKTRPGYDIENMFPFPSDFAFMAETGFTVALGKPYFINNITFRLCDNSFESSYYVEVSTDLVHWIRVIDHTNYVCSSFQNLYFEPRVARYIRLIGTEILSGESVMEVSTFSVSHVTKPIEFRCGFYAPAENVATTALDAMVIESLGESDALIRERAPGEGGIQWTSLEIGMGSIIIKFPQPYTVNSMRVLLRSDESYLYYIETSVDKENWTRVAVRTVNLSRSWQNVTFEPRPVLYTKIVGTASTGDKLFSCARFECPASARGLSESPAQEDGPEGGAMDVA